jgi:beta-glucosidase-like glycosyl hydrolase
MLAYVKHFDAYSVETNRGHDTHNISTYDFWDTYLPAYQMVFTEGIASGAMCSYNGENGHPSCANGWLLNEVNIKLNKMIGVY